MTEPAKDKIQVRKPAAYAEVPLPAANGSDPGIKSPNMDVRITEGGGRDYPTTDRVSIRSIEDAKDPSGDLVAAIQTVFRAAAAEIARHENAAKRLREAMAPFANYARQSAAPPGTPDEDVVRALFRMADELKQGEQQ
jgi:hypothetical protein